MKILGEKSFSSKVEKGLNILFYIIMALNVAFFIFSSITLFFEYSSSYIIENYLARTISYTIMSIIFLLTGIVALFIIHSFIKIFKNLKESKLFERDNINYLDKIFRLSMIIGILYFICFIGASIVLGNNILFDVLSTILIKVLILVFSVVFLIFGIGIRILSEIYKKAVEYKQENDFTI